MVLDKYLEIKQEYASKWKTLIIHYSNLFVASIGVATGVASKNIAFATVYACSYVLSTCICFWFSIKNNKNLGELENKIKICDKEISELVRIS